MSRIAKSFAAVALAAALVAPGSAATAQSATAKAAVDSGKVQGVVGEQADGFLGVVNGGGDPAIRAAVAEINAGRAEAYHAAAARAGTTPEAAGQATARHLFDRLAPGEYYRPDGGGWQRK